MNQSREIGAVAALIVLLLVLAPGLSGCAADPPHIVLSDVTGVAIVWEDVTAFDDSQSATEVSHLSNHASWDVLVSAYNRASGESFDAETTPSLFARIWLRNGTRITLHFSSQYPRDHALVHVEPGEGSGEDEWYHIKDTGLPFLVGNASWDYIVSHTTEQERSWLYGEL
jgi:hypothetical protein